MFDNFTNLSKYNIEMRKSLIDKIFFIDKFDSDIYVDFGCADGTLINFLSNLFPEKTYIGYDISKDQLELARKNNPSHIFFSDWEKLIKFVKNIKQNQIVTIVLNSVIHEVYSYGDKNDISMFWSRIYDDVFDYVVIRDMSVSRTTSRQSDPISVMKIRKKFDPDKLHEYEENWGSINENWSLVHFLLKYRYEVNWKRELYENYLPINFEKIVSFIPDNFEPIFSEHFTLPFIRNKVMEDFNVDLQDRTHLKLILKNIK